MRLTEEQRATIKRLYAEGMKEQQIARHLGMTKTTVYYWCGRKEQMIRSAVERYRNKPQEEKRKDYQRHKAYYAKYFKDRYKSDEVFREKVKKRCRECNKRRYVPKKG